MHVWAVLTESNLPWNILKYLSELFSLKMHTQMFFSKACL